MFNEKDLVQVDKPNIKIYREGPKTLTNEELIAAIITNTNIKRNPIEIGRDVAKLIFGFEGREFLQKNFSEGVDKLKKIKGIGHGTAMQIMTALAITARVQKDQRMLTRPIRSSQDVYNLCSDFVNSRQEHLVTFFLDVRNSLIERRITYIGSLDKSVAHPREILAPAVELRAANIIVVHNHPSGNPQPSAGDRGVSERLVEAGRILGIKLLDFIVITKNSLYSQVSANPGLREAVREDKPIYDGPPLQELMHDQDNYKHWEWFNGKPY